MNDTSDQMSAADVAPMDVSDHVTARMADLIADDGRGVRTLAALADIPEGRITASLADGQSFLMTDLVRLCEILHTDVMSVLVWAEDAAHDAAPTSKINHTMKTTIDVVCPLWCTMSPDNHVDELSSTEGMLLHRSADRVVSDHTAGPGVGYFEAEHEGRRLVADDVAVGFGIETNLSGVEVSSPSFWVQCRGHSFDLSLPQMRALGDAIQQVAQDYTNWSTLSIIERGHDPLQEVHPACKVRDGQAAEVPA